MKNVVYFETAKRLKDAGFPQPEPEEGQFWYSIGQELFVTGPRSHGFDGRYITIFYPNAGVVHEREQTFFLEYTFAPSDANIMKELVCYDLGFYDKGEGDEKTWIVFGLNMEEIALNDNPGEAAALAWLSIHENKSL